MWGEGGEAEAFRFRVMRAAMSATPIADTLAAVILHGVPKRFPKLKLVAVETGSEWVASAARADRQGLQAAAEGVRRGSA